MRQMNLLQGEKRRDSKKLTGRGQSRVGVKGAASDPLASMAGFRLTAIATRPAQLSLIGQYSLRLHSRWCRSIDRLAVLLSNKQCDQAQPAREE